MKKFRKGILEFFDYSRHLRAAGIYFGYDVSVISKKSRAPLEDAVHDSFSCCLMMIP